MHRLQELVRLHRQGLGPRDVATSLRMSPKTELKYRQAIAAAGLLKGAEGELPSMLELRAAVEAAMPTPARRTVVSSTDPWGDVLRRMHKEGVGPKAAWDKLRRTEPDFSVSYDAVKRLYRRLARARPMRADDVVIPVVTPPGEVAQVDFGFVGRLKDPATGAMRRAWVFVMTLGFSRLSYARVVFDQRAETWLDLHRRAFEFFGAVPRVLVPDNLKAAVVKAAFGTTDRDKLSLNRSYRDLARFFGCRIDPTPAYAPQKKGKVESMVKYIGTNWWPTCDADDIDSANADLLRWLSGTANVRTHGTTGRVPQAVYDGEERAAMRPLPTKRFVPVRWRNATVRRDSHVLFERRLYSVPWRLIGKAVWVRATPTTVEVYADDARVATHERHGRGRFSTHDPHLPEGRGDLRHRDPRWWTDRAGRIAPAVERYVRGVLESDDTLSRLTDVQAAVLLLEKVPPHRAIAAVERAMAYGNTSYRSLKRILDERLDLTPMPTFVAPAHGRLDQPRFARSAAELLAFTTESDHESH